MRFERHKFLSVSTEKAGIVLWDQLNKFKLLKDNRWTSWCCDTNFNKFSIKIALLIIIGSPNGHQKAIIMILQHKDTFVGQMVGTDERPVGDSFFITSLLFIIEMTALRNLRLVLCFTNWCMSSILWWPHSGLGYGTLYENQKPIICWCTTFSLLYKA